jgi:hypothetical protein
MYDSEENNSEVAELKIESTLQATHQNTSLFFCKLDKQEQLQVVTPRERPEEERKVVRVMSEPYLKQPYREHQPKLLKQKLKPQSKQHQE